jgi:hypothetical protein
MADKEGAASASASTTATRAAPMPPAEDDVEAVHDDRASALDSTGLPVLADSMSSLRGLMDNEYQRLRDEWAALLAERAAINKIKDRIQSVTVGEHERLRLNVSGQRFEIRASCVIKNTYFKSLLSNTFAPADADGFYYVDRDPTHVMAVINFLRDGDVDLSDLNERQLRRVRDDADFYMVGDLTTLVDRTLAARRSGTGITAIAMNGDVPTTLSFNGVFFEVSVTKRNLALHSVSFIAGENRQIHAEVFCVEGTLDGAARPSKIGETDIDAAKGQVVTITFSTIALTGSSYTIGVYSSSCPTAITVCPTTMATRDFSRHGLVVERSYHTTNARGHWTRRTGQDEFDFVGELGISA